MNNEQKQQVIEQIKSAKHVLVTVSSNPTVDELAASIGLTLAINKMDKHATTVFSGIVPSTIEFLQPEKTIETTTDSLRDFIIALDKSKADKLRYKVEDDVVRIFITPYRTTITDNDLDFSQGDFNVDLVIALGVTKRQDLDNAITSHGRILHDAAIVSLTKRESVSELGAFNWQDQQASSLCEMVASITTELDPTVVDGQMATAFLTGIIAETDRFKNEKTTPTALALSSQLMTAGANQQLIAEKLEEPEPAPALHEDSLSNDAPANQKQRVDGELEIDHSDDVDNIHIDDEGNLNIVDSDDGEGSFIAPELPVPYEPQAYEETPIADQPEQEFSETPTPPLVEEESPGQTDDSVENHNDVGKDLFEDLSSQQTTDQEDGPTLRQPESSETPIMQHGLVLQPPVHPEDPPKSDKPFDPQEAMREAGYTQQLQPSVPEADSASVPAPPAPSAPPSQTESDNTPTGDTLVDIEKSVGSTHLAALGGPPAPPAAINSTESAPLFPLPTEASSQHPANLEPPKVDTGDSTQKSNDPNAAPPVPPPMSPRFYDADGNNSNPFLNPHQ
jgi:hypothetical protein